MIILGNKYQLSIDEKKVIESKIDKIEQIDITTDDVNIIINEIENIYKNKKISYIVLNLEKHIGLELESYLEDLNYAGIKFLTFSDFSSKFLDKCHIDFNEENYKVLQDIKHDSLRQFKKRIFDILFSIVALVLLSPIMIFIVIAIKIKSPNAPVIFTQQRLGLNGRFFRVYKFRTMVPNAEYILEELLDKNPDIKEEYLKYRKLKFDPRVIPTIGNFLRKYSLDELPQFFNVFLGEMSVVGPRPYIPNEFYRHSKKYVDVITSVKPGITGFWQVQERNNATFDKRVEMDIEYIQNQSFWLDLKIILQTVVVMVFKKGAY